ncbi:hypothetical protein Lupro_11595 [Lutibacter profundi]|uniref:Hemerythrin-like domain-containing protein n=1 Tax=Lutibacter profundi TaxID=1622118 RepID=A0A0X8G8A5_9FLAO|nr:DUF542 domain-containing protein [Lutibacter profundi]AMC11868.1 hypothetical protein Lupro_11595 [Lutibacter profundi]
MDIYKEQTVAEVVSGNVGADHVFSKYNIDFCCGGNVTLEKACQEKGITFEVLKKEIETLVNSISNETNFSEMDEISIINYAQNVFHNYFKENIPLVSALALKVAEVHWKQHKEVIEINNLFNQIVPELNEQMAAEEKNLFPILKKETLQRKETELKSVVKTTQNMENVDKQIGVVFKRLANLTNSYTPPVGACNTFKLLYEKLHEVELKLHNYMHFEINILFPRVLKKLKS